MGWTPPHPYVGGPRWEACPGDARYGACRGSSEALDEAAVRPRRSDLIRGLAPVSQTINRNRDIMAPKIVSVTRFLGANRAYHRPHRLDLTRALYMVVPSPGLSTPAILVVRSG